MKRKTSILPTRVLSYGAQPPTGGAELVREQLWLAHRYYNKLIEIELERRRLYREARSSIDATLSSLETVQAELTAAIEQHRGELQLKRQSKRNRAADPLATATLRALETERRATTLALKEARLKAKQDPALMAVAERIQEETKKKIHAARAASRVTWGTYLKVEESIQAACKGPGDPKFKRWSGGEGRIVVQLQTQAGERTTIADILKGDDRRIQFLPHGTPKGPWWSKSGLHAIVRLRIGSDPKKKPIWAEFPVLLHRLPPGDAVLTWAWILVRKQGPNFRYSLQLVVESADFLHHRCGKGAIGMDLGWRQLPSGDVRVGYIVDEAGKGRELLLPKEIPAALDYADKLRGHGDRHFDTARLVFQSWLAAQTGPAADWWREETRFMHQWRAHSKLARVAENALLALGLTEWGRELWRGWSMARRQAGLDPFDTHEAIDAWLVARGVYLPEERIALYLDWWRRKDRHLYEWECNQRSKALRRRKDIYRNIAAELASTYETLVLEKFDLRAFTRNAKPEEAVTDFSHLVRNRASPHELRLAILGVWAKDRTVALPAVNSTRECHLCHHVNTTWGLPDELMQTCSGCAEEWDQDDNAARVLLHRWHEETGGSIAAE